MKNIILTLTLLASPLTVGANQTNAWKSLAALPPMGWNSYDAFGSSVTEAEFLANANYIKEKLLPSGYNTVVVDFRWADSTAANYDPNGIGGPLVADEFGRLLPSPVRFPSAADGRGFKPLADQVHDMGLKFGIHVMRGIPRQSVRVNTPIEGSRFKAVDAADTNSTCKWCKDMWGIDATKQAGQDYYDSIFRLYASWGVDFVKVDDLSQPYHKEEIEAVRRAIDKCGRPMVFSTSPGQTPVEQASHVAANANMWRIASDFWDQWKALDHAFDLAAKWQGMAGPGRWPDGDMLPLGRIGIRCAGKDRMTRFTKDEQVAMMSLWALMPSPLMLGGHQPDNDAWTLSLITNPDMLAINQDPLGKPGRRLFQKNLTEVWLRDLKDGGKAVGIFNRCDTNATVTLKVSEAGLVENGPYRIKNVWTGETMDTLGAELVIPVPRHGAVLLTGHSSSSAAPAADTTADSRDRSSMPNPEAIRRWNENKFGMFIHWGLYSEAGGVWKGRQIENLGEQIQRFGKIPRAEYEQLAPRFNPVAFDADAWVALAKSAGMKYIVITAKHHDGFCMFDSKLTYFTITKATPFKKDPIKLLSEACARGGIGFGVYFSNIDWHFPGAIPQDFNNLNVFDTISEEHNRYNKGQIEELLTGYGPVVQVFFDMGKPKLEQSMEWATLVHMLQPNCLVNGRVMNNQGDFLTMPDNGVPEIAIPQAWESPSTLYSGKMDTWGYKSWITRPELKGQVARQILKMVTVISRGGNFVLNVGPNGKGEIIPYEQDVLKTMGAWVKSHEEALFGTTHNPFKKLEWGHCTVKDKTLYFFVVNWPKDRLLRIPGLKSEIKSAALLTKKDSPLAYSKNGDDLVVTLPANAPDDVCPVVAVELGGELAIVDPLVKPDKQGQITLTRKEAITYARYSGMGYSSMTANVRYGWDFATSRAGDYSVKVSSVGVTGKLRISVGAQTFELKPESVEVVTLHLSKSERLTLNLSGENPNQTIQGKIESVTLTPL